jgi:hypothetical protein
VAFFKNNAVNRLNIHFGIESFATNAGGVFYFVVLYQEGLSLPGTLLAMALILVGRFVMRPILIPLSRIFNLRHLLIIGTLMQSLQYPVLAEVHGLGPPLFMLCFLSAVGSVFYWVSFHAYTAAVGDAEHRGHQLSAREMTVAIIGIIAPLMGAWGLVNLGSLWTFCGVALVQAAASLPLLGAPDISIKREGSKIVGADWIAIWIMVADGWICTCILFVWQLGLFLTLSHSFSAYGAAMALAGGVGAVCGLFLGKHVDAGYGRHAVVIAYSVEAAIVLLRATSLDSPVMATIANGLGAVLSPLLIPVSGTALYNLAKLSHCPFRFQLATEGAWDVGCFTGCVCSAGLIYERVPISLLLMMALPAILAQGLILWAYFGKETASPRVREC